MSEPILLSISPNEGNTPDRVADLVAAIASFRGQIVRIQDDAKQPADIQMKGYGRYVHIEVKEIRDLWQGKQGHFGDQIVNLTDQPATSFAVVLGNFDEARADVPTMTTVKTARGHKARLASNDLMESNRTSLRALNADCVGSCIPIFYFSRDRVVSFQEALSYGKNLLIGGDPFQWCSRHKGKARKIRALLGNGIGEKNAETLIQRFGNLRNLGNASYEDLLKTPGIGPERAISILELFR